MDLYRKEKIITTLKYTWPIYLGIGLLSVLGWYYAFNIHHAPKDYEKLSLFISGNVKSTDFLDEIKDEFSDRGVKKVDSYSCSIKESIYLQKLTVVGYASADLIIIPESILKNLNIPAFALEIDEIISSSFTFAPAYYEAEGQNYGLLIDNALFEDEVSFSDENNYLFINASSHNIDEEHNNAFQLVNYLMNL